MLKKFSTFKAFSGKILDVIFQSGSIVAIMKAVFQDSFLRNVTLRDTIIGGLILSMITLFWRLFGPVLGYRSAIKKCEIYDSLNQKEKAIEVLKYTLYENKLANKKKANMLYELSYRYFHEEGAEAVEGYIDEILKLELKNHHKINLKLKIATYILSRIDKHKAVDFFDEIINDNGYVALQHIDFFRKDRCEINTMLFLDIYAEIKSIERAKEIYSNLRENQCCKRSKTVEKFLKEIEKEIRSASYEFKRT